MRAAEDHGHQARSPGTVTRHGSDTGGALLELQTTWTGRWLVAARTPPAVRAEELFAALSEAHYRGGSLLDFVAVARAHTAEIRFTKPASVQGAQFTALALLARPLRR